MPPCSLRRRKFDYEMVHSEVYLNKRVVSIAPFSTPPFRKLLFSACFRFLIFHPFFQGGGSADPICPYVRTPMPRHEYWTQRGFHFYSCSSRLLCYRIIHCLSDNHEHRPRSFVTGRPPHFHPPLVCFTRTAVQQHCLSRRRVSPAISSRPPHNCVNISSETLRRFVLFDSRDRAE